jgi:cation transport ATPase
MSTFDEVKAAIFVAKHAAELMAENIKQLPPLDGKEPHRASVAMSLSSRSVALNGLRLRQARP